MSCQVAIIGAVGITFAVCAFLFLIYVAWEDRQQMRRDRRRERTHERELREEFREGRAWGRILERRRRVQGGG